MFRQRGATSRGATPSTTVNRANEGRMTRSPLHIILFVAFVDLTSFGLIIPLQAVYAERLGASGLVLGLLISSYAGMQFVFNPVLGRWSDRLGRRPILLTSIGGSVVSHSLLGVADLSASLPLLFLARALDGITGANIATAQAYIADVTATEDRAKGMGLFGAAVGVGFVVGPALGAALAALGRSVSGESGTSWPAFGSALIAAAAFIVVWRGLPESRRQRQSGESDRRSLLLPGLASAMRRPRFRELLLFNFVVTFAFVLLEATFVYLCIARFAMTERGTGLMFAYFGVMMILVQGGLVGRLTPRYGEACLLARGPFITAAGFVLLGAIPGAEALWTAWLLLLSGCLLTPLGHGITAPNLNALISKSSEGGGQGTAFGLSQGIASLSRTLSPPVAGLLFDRGASWPYWAGAALFLGSGLFAIRIRGVQEASMRETANPTDAASRENHTVQTNAPKAK